MLLSIMQLCRLLKLASRFREATVIWQKKDILISMPACSFSLSEMYNMAFFS